MLEECGAVHAPTQEKCILLPFHTGDHMAWPDWPESGCWHFSESEVAHV